MRKNYVIPECFYARAHARSTFREELDVLLRKCRGSMDSRLKHAGMTLLLCALCCGLMFPEFSVAFAEEFVYDNHGKRDPFISPGQTDAGNGLWSGELRLEGVIKDVKGDSYALVNGEIIREGDSLQGFLLKKVESNRAIFDKDGEILEVVLNQDEEELRQYLENQKNSN